MGLNIQVYDVFSDGGQTANVGTTINVLVQPFLGRARDMKPFGQVGIAPWQIPDRGRLHLTDLLYATPSFQHTIYLMRPLNYTTAKGAVAAGSNPIVLLADPGIYSLNYKYPTGGSSTVPTDVADRSAIGANDWIAYQISTGLFVLDKVASVSGLSLTMTNAIPTGGILNGSLVYLFGQTTDTVPYTRAVHTKWQPDVSSSTYALTTRQYGGNADNFGFQCHHTGDPLMIQSNNTGGALAGIFQRVGGCYAEW